MSKPTIAIPTVLPEEIEQLTELRQSVRRVHKSVPSHSPIRKTSADLSDRLLQLHRRGVPLHTLADLIGLSHQAVRVRVRSASSTAARSKTPPRSAVKGAPTLNKPTPDVVLVADAGVHRRLHVFDPPEDAGAAYLTMIPSIPLLEDRQTVVRWLESESNGTLPNRPSANATRLRTPPAVYLPREMVYTVLVPLTSLEESRSDDAEHDADPS